MVTLWRAPMRRRSRWPWRFAAANCLLLVIGGCGRATPRLEPPAIDAEQAGRAAIAEYDTNGDGVLSGGELNQCPGLKSALKQYDKQGTGKITAAEIAERIGKWKEGRVYMSKFAINFTLDGQPLVGATITAEPEQFLGPGVPIATGTTNAYGTVFPQVGPKLPGIYYGIYKLRVSKLKEGRETIPERYNKHTELGFEKAPDTPGFTNLKLDLKSK